MKDIPSLYLQKSAFEDDVRDYYFFTYLLRPELLKEGVDRTFIFKALWEEGVSLGTGWGVPLYKSVAWNVPEHKFIKMDTPVSEDVMANRLMATLHNLLLADEDVLERWGEALRKVMLAVTK